MLRTLTEADIPDLMDLAEKMHGESVYSHYRFYPGQTEYILRALVQKESCFSMGYERHGHIIGAFLGEVVPDLWCHVKVAQDVVFYVHPGFRGSSAGYRLIQAFEDWSRESGADVIRPVVYAGIDNQGASSVLERMGFAAAGTIHKKDVRECASA